MVRPRHQATAVRRQAPCDKRDLPSNVVLGQPPHLSVTDYVHRHDTLNRPRRRIKRPEALTRSYPPFDRSVILLHYVVEVADRTAPAASSEFSGALKFSDDLRIRGIPVHVGHPWTWVTSCPQCLLEGALGSSRVPSGRQEKLIVAPVESATRYKYVHLPATRRYFSSTRHDRFVLRSSRRQRWRSSGAYRCTLVRW